MRNKIQVNDMKHQAADAAKMLKVLANPARLMILCQLVQGEQCAGDLWSKSTLSQSAFSQHLSVLRKNKIVKTRKSSQVVYYALEDDKAVRILEVLYRLYCR